MAEVQLSTVILILVYICLPILWFVYRSDLTKKINDKFGVLIPSFLWIVTPFLVTSTWSFLDKDINREKLKVVISILSPLIVAGTAAYINWTISSRNYRREDENQKQEALKDYIKQIKELLKDASTNGSTDDDKDDEILKSIKHLTAIVVQELDSSRNRKLIFFLRDTRLPGNKRLCIDLQCADLTRAQLEKVDLRGANIEGADLSGACLEGAILSNASLKRACLKGANLRNVFMKRGNLSSANLKQADLSEAYLRFADLSLADLDGTDLRKAYLEGAKLGESKNLDRANVRDATCYIEEESAGEGNKINLHSPTEFPETYDLKAAGMRIEFF